MMKRKNNQLKRSFKIPQIPKIDGILSNKNKSNTPFVSPVYGLDNKDEISVPFRAHIDGDKDKKYDAFRKKSKLTPEYSKEKYGREYFEFKNFVDKEVRKKLYGVDTYKKKDVHEEIKEPIINKPKEEIKEVVISE